MVKERGKECSGGMLCVQIEVDYMGCSRSVSIDQVSPIGVCLLRWSSWKKCQQCLMVSKVKERLWRGIRGPPVHRRISDEALGGDRLAPAGRR